jgi:hypothetical protein
MIFVGLVILNSVRLMIFKIDYFLSFELEKYFLDDNLRIMKEITKINNYFYYFTLFNVYLILFNINIKETIFLYSLFSLSTNPLN